MTDPFAIDPFSDFDAPAEAVRPEPPVERKPVTTASGEGKIVTTLKGGSGFEAPWIVIHASNVEESEELLNLIYTKGYHERVLKAATMFNGGKASGGAASSRSAGASRASAPPGVKPEYCYHDIDGVQERYERVYKTGNGAKGQWKALFCGAPQEIAGGQCGPKWLK